MSQVTTYKHPKFALTKVVSAKNRSQECSISAAFGPLSVLFPRFLIKADLNDRVEDEVETETEAEHGGGVPFKYFSVSDDCRGQDEMEVT